jgi:Cof subfamily protein (haloacid dehalogenase superfamily)
MPQPLTPNPQPPYRLVALDLDGTLLDSRARISPANAAAIAACTAAGVTVAIATGKLFVSVAPMVAALSLVGPQILNNGAVVIDAADGAVLHMTPLPGAAVQAVVAALVGYGLPAAVYTPHAIHTPVRDPRIDILLDIHEPEPIVLPDVGQRSEVGGWPFVKILTVLDTTDPATPAREAALHARFAATLTVVRTSRYFYEFLAPGVSKGAALQWLAARMGLPLSATLAIGDSYNDLPLLAAAGLGVAMGNAPPVIQAAAAALTADNDHDGVALALRRYVLGLPEPEP